MKISGYLSRLAALGACLALTSALVTAAPNLAKLK